MSKIPMPFTVGDISELAKTLRRQLDGLERLPSHVEMLNLLAKAGGYRNFQHFKAQHDAQTSLKTPQQPPAEVNFKLVKKLVRHFDDEGRLIRWPKKFTMRGICLWIMWSRIAARTSLTEREVNERLEEQHLFGDYALLRRELVDRGMISRTADGSSYQRVELQPPAEAIELLKHLREAA